MITLLWMLCLLLLSGCSSLGENKPDDVDEEVLLPSNLYRVNSGRIECLVIKSKNGDGDASYELFLIYAIGYNNQTEAIEWLRIAADQENQKAVEALKTIGKHKQ